jgi:hypothetical protein
MNATSMMLAGFVAKLRRNGEKNKFFPVFLEIQWLFADGLCHVVQFQALSSSDG